MERFRSVREGKIKNISELEELKKNQDEKENPLVKEKVPETKDGRVITVDKKIIITKKDVIISNKTIKGMNSPIMLATKEERKLGKLDLKEIRKNILTLSDSIQKALEFNYGVKINTSNVNIAEQELQEVINKLLPTLNYSANMTKLNEAMGFKIGAAPRIEMSDDNQKSQSLSLQIPVYTFGKIKYGKRAAKFNLLSKKDELEDSVIELAYQVKQAFYGMLITKELVKIENLSLKQMSEHVKTVKSQYEVGMASKFDLLRVEVQKANIKPQLIKAKMQLKKARDGFNMLLGIPINTKFELEGELKASRKFDIDEKKYVDIAKLERQDLKKAKKAYSAAKAAYEATRRGKTPTLAFSSTYNRNHGNGIPTNKWNEGWNAALALQVPLADQKVTHTSRKKALERIKQADIGVEMAENKVVLDVRTALNDIEEAKELIRASEKNIEQAEEAYNIANISYENGLNTNLEVMDAHLALDQARINHLQAMYGMLLAKAKLNRSIGTIGIFK